MRDSMVDAFRRYLRERGIAHTIPPIRRTGRRRRGRRRPASVCL
jgi:hypothetical protein